jgi:hypothetical protein
MVPMLRRELRALKEEVASSKERKSEKRSWNYFIKKTYFKEDVFDASLFRMAIHRYNPFIDDTLISYPIDKVGIDQFEKTLLTLSETRDDRSMISSCFDLLRKRIKTFDERIDSLLSKSDNRLTYRNFDKYVQYIGGITPIKIVKLNDEAVTNGYFEIGSKKMIVATLDDHDLSVLIDVDNRDIRLRSRCSTESKRFYDSTKSVKPFEESLYVALEKVIKNHSDPKYIQGHIDRTKRIRNKHTRLFASGDITELNGYNLVDDFLPEGFRLSKSIIVLFMDRNGDFKSYGNNPDKYIRLTLTGMKKTATDCLTVEDVVEFGYILHCNNIYPLYKQDVHPDLLKDLVLLGY